jgi:hypothetical protein
MLATSTALRCAGLRKQLDVGLLSPLKVSQKHAKLAVTVNARTRKIREPVGDADGEVPPVEAQSADVVSEGSNTLQSSRRTRGARVARGSRRSAARGKPNDAPAVGLEVLEKMEVVKTDEDGYVNINIYCSNSMAS